MGRFAPSRRDQLYHHDRCRKAAWRERRREPSALALTDEELTHLFPGVSTEIVEVWLADQARYASLLNHHRPW